MPLNIYLFANLWAGVFNDSGSWAPSALARVGNGTVLLEYVVMKMVKIFYTALPWWEKEMDYLLPSEDQT